MSSVPLGTMNLAPVTPLTVFSLFHYQRTNNTYEMLKNMSGKPSFFNKNMNVRHLITMLNSRVDVGFGFVQNSVRRPDFWSVWLLPFWFLKNLILAALLTSSLQGWSAVFFVLAERSHLHIFEFDFVTQQRKKEIIQGCWILNAWNLCLERNSTGCMWWWAAGGLWRVTFTCISCSSISGSGASY